jgi:radical SAM superfamily enzyme YgiQ (UPF0313 family)
MKDGTSNTTSVVRPEIPGSRVEASVKGNILVLAPGEGGKQKNVVRDFVYGCWCNGRRIGGTQMPPLNNLYVSTILKDAGHDVRFIDAQVEYQAYEQLDSESFSGLDFLVIMSSTNSFRADVVTAKHIKAGNPSVKVLFFGSHPTFMPRNCLSENVIDYIVLREPEFTIRKLVAKVLAGEEIGGMPGIGFRKGGETVINEEAAFFDINDLPIPDWTMLPKGVDYFNPVVKRMPFATMQTSRGCPGKCIFCTAPAFYGRKLRVKSEEHVLTEIRYLLELGYREIFFRDETFTAYKKRNQKICQAILDEGLDFTWIANGRVDMIDRETMDLMRKAGCHMLKFGVETGDPGILESYKKGTTIEQCRQAFRNAREAGLDTHAHMIFGGPGESEETFRRTIGFLKEIRPTTASFGLLMPYPGTQFFKMVAGDYPEFNDGTECDMEKLHTTAYFSETICGLAPDELQKMLGRAYRAFYLRPGYLLGWLKRIGSMDELMRLLVAGSNVIQFSLTTKK